MQAAVTQDNRPGARSDGTYTTVETKTVLGMKNLARQLGYSILDVWRLCSGAGWCGHQNNQYVNWVRICSSLVEICYYDTSFKMNASNSVRWITPYLTTAHFV